MRKNILPCLFALFFIAIYTQAAAQNRYLTKAITITIPTVLELELSSGASVTADFNQSVKLDNGLELLNASIITYKSNKSWFATIKAANPYFGGGDVSTPMPASVIQYRLNGSGMAYINLSDTEQILMGSSSAKLDRGRGTGSIDFKINPGYIYPPATDYNLQVIYTISNL